MELGPEHGSSVITGKPFELRLSYVISSENSIALVFFSAR